MYILEHVRMVKDWVFSGWKKREEIKIKSTSFLDLVPNGAQGLQDLDYTEDTLSSIILWPFSDDYLPDSAPHILFQSESSWWFSINKQRERVRYHLSVVSVALFGFLTCHVLNEVNISEAIGSSRRARLSPHRFSLEKQQVQGWHLLVTSSSRFCLPAALPQRVKARH